MSYNQKEINELLKSMKNLSKEYALYLKDTKMTISKLSNETSTDMSLKAQSSYYINFVYVGRLLAPLTGLQLWCDQGGYAIIEDILKIGGGASAVGGALYTALLGTAAATAMAPYAAIVGGVIIVYSGVLKLQLNFVPLATIYI